MKRNPIRFLWRNLLFCSIILICILVVKWLMPAAEGGVYKDDIDGVAKESIDLLGEMNKFLSSTAFIVVGVLGNIIIGKTKVDFRETAFSTILFFGSMIFALLSIFYSYLSYSKLFEIVSTHLIDFNNRQLAYAQAVQFYTLFISVVLFAWYIFNVYLGVKNSPPEDKSAQP